MKTTLLNKRQASSDQIYQDLRAFKFIYLYPENDGNSSFGWYIDASNPKFKPGFIPFNPPLASLNDVGRARKLKVYSGTMIRGDSTVLSLLNFAKASLPAVFLS